MLHFLRQMFLLVVSRMRSYINYRHVETNMETSHEHDVFNAFAMSRQVRHDEMIVGFLL